MLKLSDVKPKKGTSIKLQNSKVSSKIGVQITAQTFRSCTKKSEYVKYYLDHINIEKNKLDYEKLIKLKCIKRVNLTLGQEHMEKLKKISEEYKITPHRMAVAILEKCVAFQ